MVDMIMKLIHIAPKTFMWIVLLITIVVSVTIEFFIKSTYIFILGLLSSDKAPFIEKIENKKEDEEDDENKE